VTGEEDNGSRGSESSLDNDQDLVDDSHGSCSYCGERVSGDLKEHIETVHILKRTARRTSRVKELEEEAETALRYADGERELMARRALVDEYPEHTECVLELGYALQRNHRFMESAIVLKDLRSFITAEPGWPEDLSLSPPQLDDLIWRVERVRDRWAPLMGKGHYLTESTSMDSLVDIARISLFNDSIIHEEGMDTHVNRLVKEIVALGDPVVPLVMEALLSSLDHNQFIPTVLASVDSRLSMIGLVDGLCLDDGLADECARHLRTRMVTVDDQDGFILGIVEENREESWFLTRTLARLGEMVPSVKLVPALESLLEGTDEEAIIAGAVIAKVGLQRFRDRLTSEAVERDLLALNEYAVLLDDISDSLME